MKTYRRGPRVKGCDAARMKAKDPVCDGSCMLALMSRDHDCAAALAEAGEQLDHLPGGFDVHIGERLVEKEQFRNWEQDASE